ncbi:nitroreductase family protein [Patescibacteria group bacterium]|nr:nitroreductase family protein [Patescibacteria group bacterium]
MIDLRDVAKKKRKNAHQILDEVIYRWSPRSMTGEPISEEELTPLFEAARWAPSHFNYQEWHFHYALRDTKAFQELFSLLVPGNQKWCDKAGTLMILVSKKISDENQQFIRTHSLDTGAAWQSFAIEGIRRNLVIHAMAGFDYDKAAEYLHLAEDEYQVECMIAVGKPNQEVIDEDMSLRKNLEEIITKLE